MMKNSVVFLLCFVFFGFTACPFPEPLPKDMQEIRDYLTAQPGGESADDPIDLILNIDLPYVVTRYGDRYPNISNLLLAIAYSKKYVNLDLSGCGMDEPFLSFGGSANGRKYVINLVLPDKATTINSFGNVSSENRSARGVEPWDYFSNLKAVSGKNIIVIEGAPFMYSNKLVDVDFPNAVIIGWEAFYRCIRLENISFPLVTSIGDMAFFECRNFQDVSFPLTVSIGQGAFYGCDNLACIDLSSVQNIGNYVFRDNRKHDLVITMGSVAPTVGYGVFDIPPTSTKSVTVFVPAGATGYGDFIGEPPHITLSGQDETVCWGNGLRGMGWDGNSFITDNYNLLDRNISVTIIQQEEIVD